MANRTDELLERIASGVEKMASDPEVEIEFGPPLCPTCGKINPTVTLGAEDGGVGPLAEIFFSVLCECGARIHVNIESYSCHAQLEDARTELRERNARENF